MKPNPPDSSVCELLLHHEKYHTNRIYLRQPKARQWHELTWGAVVEQARRVAGFLKSRGLKPGDHVSIFSKNCAEWFIADFGITLAGMVNVPLFPNQGRDNVAYVLEHAEVQLVFVGKLDDHERMRSYLPEGIATVGFDYHLNLKTDYRWVDVLISPPLEEIAMPQPDDVYTIIYSSGTSGNPKGAVFTQAAITRYLTLFPEDLKRFNSESYHRFISYLPLAHVYERSTTLLGSLCIPSDVSFVESLDQFANNLQEVEPTLFPAVPRIWGLFKQKIEQKISPNRLKWLLRLPIISHWFKQKIRKQLGLARCSSAVSGAAHLPASMLKFFKQLDIIIQEGYGQTENMAYATLSLPELIKVGYVGTPRLQVEIKEEGGELLIKSPCLMREYYREPEATRLMFTQDGWLRTGDLVEIDALDRVRILGRLSESFKNQKGEFVSPYSIEKYFQRSASIENLCLVGRELPSNILLATLSPQALGISQDEMREHLRSLLKSINPSLESHEKVSHILVVNTPWNIENGFLTPTFKVKRRQVESHYQQQIQKAAETTSGVVWES